MRVLDLEGEYLLQNISNIIEYDDNICEVVDIEYPYEEDKDVIIDKKDYDFEHTTVKVFGYKSDDNKLFGYKEKLIKPKVKRSKALIKRSGERKFLKRVGILYENINSGGSGELPIIAFFKADDNVIRGCKVKVIKTSIKDGDIIEEVESVFIVSDIKSVGLYGVVNYIYILVPER